MRRDAKQTALMKFFVKRGAANLLDAFQTGAGSGRLVPGPFAMIKIAITQAAFEAIASALPLGSVGYEHEGAGRTIRAMDGRKRQLFGRRKQNLPRKIS